MKELIFSQGDFTLVKESGIGVNDTPWEGLAVISEGKANDFVIEVRLLGCDLPRFEGKLVHYKYSEVSVAHGFASRHETLKDTEDYIECLKEAVEFARRVEHYIQNNEEWRA